MKISFFLHFGVLIIMLCWLVRAQWPFEFKYFHRRCAVERSGAISIQNYLLFETVLTMIIMLSGQFILRTMHLIMSAHELFVFLMSQDMNAVGMRACRHCRTPLHVLENHRDEKAPDDKIRSVLIAIYCSWTSSLTQLSKNFDTFSDRPVHRALPTEISKFEWLL